MNKFEELVRISAEEIAKNILGYESDAQYGDSQPSFTDDIDRISAVIKWHMDEACNRRAPEPGTSVIRWTRYDGTPETLPERKKGVLLSRYGEIFLTWRPDDPNPYFIKNPKPMWNEEYFSDIYAKIGDLWAYLPEPPEVMK